MRLGVDRRGQIFEYFSSRGEQATIDDGVKESEARHAYYRLEGQTDSVATSSVLHKREAGYGRNHSAHTFDVTEFHCAKVIFEPMKIPIAWLAAQIFLNNISSGTAPTCLRKNTLDKLAPAKLMYLNLYSTLSYYPRATLDRTPNLGT
jgi:hypothetical protein